MKARLPTLNVACASVFGFAAFALLVCVLVWPEWAERLLRSRWAVALVALQCEAVALVLNAELRAGVAQGFRAFWDDLDGWR